MSHIKGIRLNFWTQRCQCANIYKHYLRIPMASSVYFFSSLAQQPISPHSIGYFRDRNGVGWNRCCVRKWESAKLNDNQHDFVCVFFSLSLKFPTSHYLILKIWLGILEFHSNVQRFIDRIRIYLIQIVCPPNGWNVHLKRKSSQHERHRQHYLHK